MKTDTLTNTPDETGTQVELDDAEAVQLMATWKAEKAGKLNAGADAGADEDADDEDADAAVEDDGDGSADTDADDEQDGKDADSEDETEEEEEDPDKKEEQEKPEEPKTKMQKRFDVLTARNKELQATLEQTQQEIASLKSGARPNQPISLVPLPEDPLSHLTAPEEVDAALERARGFIQWAKTNRNGATVDGKEMSADDVEAFRSEQEAILAAAPARLKWLGEYQASHAAAMQHFPEMFQQGTDANKFVSAVTKHVPGLARHAGHEQLIGDMWTGAQIRLGKLKLVKASAKPAAPPAKTATAVKPKPSMSSSASVPASSPRGAKPDNSATIKKAFSGEIDGDDAAAAMLDAKFS